VTALTISVTLGTAHATEMADAAESPTPVVMMQVISGGGPPPEVASGPAEVNVIVVDQMALSAGGEDDALRYGSRNQDSDDGGDKHRK